MQTVLTSNQFMSGKEYYRHTLLVNSRLVHSVMNQAFLDWDARTQLIELLAVLINLTILSGIQNLVTGTKVMVG